MYIYNICMYIYIYIYICHFSCTFIRKSLRAKPPEFLCFENIIPGTPYWNVFQTY